MSKADYHVHTSFSIDSEEPMDRQCQAAIAAGIREIAFTEHVDHDECDRQSKEEYDYQAYCDAIDRYRYMYGDELTILKAAEIDWNHSIASDVEDFLGHAEFDFIIGSVHNLGHRYVGFHSVEEFGGFFDMYEHYYDELEGLVEAGFPSVIGHLDLPRRYHGRSPLEVDSAHFEKRLRRIFRKAAERGIGFEVNTSGIRRGSGVTFPEASVLAWYVEEGGAVITIGSDSHRASDTGDAIDQAERDLVAAGIDWRTSFVGGAPKTIKLVGTAAD